MSATPRTDASIARLEAQRDALDAAIAAFSAGVEEYRIGSVMERRSGLGTLLQRRENLESNLSRLYALKDHGSRTVLSPRTTEDNCGVWPCY